jgi:protein ImuB
MGPRFCGEPVGWQSGIARSAPLPPRPRRARDAGAEPARNDLAGPWRSSGDWWTPDPWSRDEWDIALSDGGLYRLYCDPAGWFVEGSYD